MRYSYQREEILKLIQSTTCHPTADWVYDEVRKVVPNISLGTVYRNLNQLVDSRQIRAINDGPVIRYDGTMEPHDHFKCTSCNKVYDIVNQTVDVMEVLSRHSEHLITGYSLNLEGLCGDCRKEIS